MAASTAPRKPGTAGPAAGAALGAVATLAAAVGALWAGFRAVHASSNGSNARLDVALAAVGAVAALVFLRWTMHAEHRLRRGDPVAASYGPGVSVISSLAVGFRAGRRYAPLSATAALLLGVPLLAGLVYFTVHAHEEAATSALVQGSGIAASGTVEVVNETYHYQRDGMGYYTTELYVHLRHPVLGASTTDVYVPSSSDLTEGSTVSVLVDPKDPSYAELPGDPSTPQLTWQLLAVADALIALLLVGALAGRLRYRRHRLAAAAAARAGTAPQLAGVPAPAVPAPAGPQLAAALLPGQEPALASPWAADPTGAYGPVLQVAPIAFPAAASSAEDGAFPREPAALVTVGAAEPSGAAGSSLAPALAGAGAGPNLLARYEAPADSAPADLAPADSAPPDSAPADSAPADSAPADSAPAAASALLGTTGPDAGPTGPNAGPTGPNAGTTGPGAGEAEGITPVAGTTGEAAPGAGEAEGIATGWLPGGSMLGATSAHDPESAGGGRPQGSATPAAAELGALAEGDELPPFTAPEHPPAWHPDPLGRFRLRYWDGSSWTQWVSDGAGATATDPLVETT